MACIRIRESAHGHDFKTDARTDMYMSTHINTNINMVAKMRAEMAKAGLGGDRASTEEKDASGGREFGLASAEYLEMLRSARGGRHLVEVCDMLAQDYICFGFEPPEGCGRLAALMREHGLLSSRGGGRL